MTPQEAGLTHYGSRRRVTGLRREELALLARISIEYYIRLERGSVRGVSDEVLNSVATALKLDDVERRHLFDLIRSANAIPVGRRGAAPQQVRPSVQQVLNSMTEAAAFVRNARLDVLAANSLGSALYSQALVSTGRPPNLAYFVFIDPAARTFYRIGIASRTTRSEACVPKQDETRRTERCRSWSPSCRPAANSFARAGRPTMSSTTEVASSCSVIRSSVTSTSTTTRLSCQRIRV